MCRFSRASHHCIVFFQHPRGEEEEEEDEEAPFHFIQAASLNFQLHATVLHMHLDTPEHLPFSASNSFTWVSTLLHPRFPERQAAAAPGQTSF